MELNSNGKPQRVPMHVRLGDTVKVRSRPTARLSAQTLRGQGASRPLSCWARTLLRGFAALRTVGACCLQHA